MAKSSGGGGRGGYGSVRKSVLGKMTSITGFSESSIIRGNTAGLIGKLVDRYSRMKSGKSSLSFAERSKLKEEIGKLYGVD